MQGGLSFILSIWSMVLELPLGETYISKWWLATSRFGILTSPIKRASSHTEQPGAPVTYWMSGTRRHDMEVKSKLIRRLLATISDIQTLNGWPHTPFTSLSLLQEAIKLTGKRHCVVDWCVRTKQPSQSISLSYSLRCRQLYGVRCGLQTARQQTKLLLPVCQHVLRSLWCPEQQPDRCIDLYSWAFSWSSTSGSSSCLA